MNLEEIMLQLNLDRITPLGQIADDSHVRTWAGKPSLARPVSCKYGRQKKKFKMKQKTKNTQQF